MEAAAMHTAIQGLVKQLQEERSSLLVPHQVQFRGDQAVVLITPLKISHSLDLTYEDAILVLNNLWEYISVNHVYLNFGFTVFCCGVMTAAGDLKAALTPQGSMMSSPTKPILPIR